METVQTEIIQKKNKTQAYQIVTVLGLIFSVVFLASIITFMVTQDIAYQAMAGESMGLGIFIQYFYQNNGIMVVLFLILSLGLLLRKNSRSLFAQVWLWGILLVEMINIAAFFTNISYYAQMIESGQYQPISALDFTSLFVPSICSVICLVALLANWHNADKTKVKKISAISTIVAIGFTVYYLIRRVSMELEQGASDQTISMMADISCILVIVFTCLLVHTLVRNRQVFYMAIHKKRTSEVEDDGEELTLMFEEPPEVDSTEVDAFLEEMIAVEDGEAATEQANEEKQTVIEQETKQEPEEPADAVDEVSEAAKEPDETAEENVKDGKEE